MSKKQSLKMNQPEAIMGEGLISTGQEAEKLRFCDIVKPCGHNCDGVRGEEKCLPCMSDECKAATAAEQVRRQFKYTESDNCEICMESLGEAPCIQVCKKHVFHA